MQEKKIILSIVSIDFVSNFVPADYTTIWYAVYNGFAVLSSKEHCCHLHGEVVSYGILVLLTADNQHEVRGIFNKFIGLPTCLADIRQSPRIWIMTR